MPYPRPSLSDLISRVSGDLAQKLGSGPFSPSSPNEAVARAWAGLMNELHGGVEFLSRQLFATLAEGDFLDLIGSYEGVVRKLPEKAVGVISVTGSQSAVMPAGTRWQRTSDGVQFETNSEHTFPASQDTAGIAVTAIESGSTANSDVDTPFQIVSPLANVQSNATVSATGIIGGTDIEDDDAYRARVLSKRQTPPDGGSTTDFEQWALAVAGVTRAFVLGNHPSVGKVTVLIVADDDPSGPIPSASLVADTQAAIDLVRPVTAITTVSAPAEAFLNPTLTLLGADTATLRLAVEAALRDLVQREGIAGSTLALSRFQVAVGTTPGVADFTLDTFDLPSAASPPADVVVGNTELLRLGTVTFNAAP